MITKNRVLLIATKKTSISFLRNFEAISQIKEKKEIQQVWMNNKTPVFLNTDRKSHKNFDCKVLYLTDDNVKSVKNFTEFSYLNGFEPGEYWDGKYYDTESERCILCEIAGYKGMPTNLENYNKNVEDEVDCIIYESPRFYVTSELGAMKMGFLMIVPKEHILSVAQFPAGFLAEFQQVCKDVEIILKGTFGEDKTVTFFEHGSGNNGKSSHPKSIVHAHVHVVVDFKLDKKYLEMVKCKPIEDISEAKNTHYFSYQEGFDGNTLISMDPNVYVQRQFPRQVMAEELKLAPEQYNWRKVKFSENVKATLYRILQYLQEGNTSVRIKERSKGFVNGYTKRDS